MIDCSNNKINKYEFKKKCYEKCPEGSVISEKNNFFCEVKCNKEFPYEEILTQECTKNYSINDRFKGLCMLNYIDNTENEDSQDELLDNIRTIITKEMNLSNLENGKEITFKEKDAIYSFTTTKNEYWKN